MHSAKTSNSGMVSVGSMPLLPVQSTPSISSPSSSDEDDTEEYVMFVAEDEKGNPYFMEKSLVGSCTPDIHPEFLVLPPETLALLSDSIVVLDTEREIFVWIGADRQSLEVDQVYDSCLSLALSMNQHRFPPSIIRVVKEGSSNARYVLSYLIPSHKDPIEASFHSLPVLATLPSPYLRQHCNKFLRTDDMSFREYMVKIYHFKYSVFCKSDFVQICSNISIVHRLFVITKYLCYVVSNQLYKTPFYSGISNLQGVVL